MDLWTSVCASIAAITTVALHYFPWRAVRGRELSRPEAYTLGVLAMMIPLTVYFLSMGRLSGWQAVVTMWVTAVGAGIGTIGTYALDSALDSKQRAAEAEERERRAYDEGA
jgi:hypothetical protein